MLGSTQSNQSDTSHIITITSKQETFIPIRSEDLQSD